MGRVSALTSQAFFQIVSIYQVHRFARDSVCPSLPLPPPPKKKHLQLFKRHKGELVEGPYNSFKCRQRDSKSYRKYNMHVWYLSVDVKSSVKKKVIEEK